MTLLIRGVIVTIDHRVYCFNELPDQLSVTVIISHIPLVAADGSRMATTHVSIPKCFSGGDTREWLQKSEICSEANEWDAAKKAKKLPTVLERKAGAN